MGTLYLVATPIGNLEDITYRAVRTLQGVDLIAAEDTRRSGRLLKHYDVRTRLVSFHGHSSENRVQHILHELESGDVALISDAGVPGISDPGADLVRAALGRGVHVEVVPGPSAVTTAVAVSGLVDAGFLFAGYPPRRAGQRTAFLSRLAMIGYPIVLFESPHRLMATLEDLRSTFAGSQIAVCREMTKLHETVVRGKVEDVHRHFQFHPPRGEFVLVLRPPADQAPSSTSEDVDALARKLVDQGLSTSAAAREVASLCGIARSDAYELVMRAKSESRS